MTGDKEETPAGEQPEKKTPEAPLEWSIKVWERDPRKRVVVLIIAICCGLLGVAMIQNILVGLIGFLAIIGSTAEFWFPLKFHLDENVARVRCGISTTEIEWTAIKRVIEGEGGVKLSPLAKPTRLAAYRGVFLRYSDNRETVLDYIRKYGGDSARLLGQRTDGD